MRTSAEQTVGEIALAQPASARVFETLGIDYCCGGSRSLGTACAHVNVPVETVIGLLDECDQSTHHGEWNDAPLGELPRYIVERHHGFIRSESPRIEALLIKVCHKHGRAHAELSDLKTLFAELTEELGEHMLKEERILFPYIQTLSDQTRPRACFGSVESPIARMIAEHENAGKILSKMRALSHGYKPPEGACATFHATYRALEEFERDLHWHVHLENNILFPRAIEAERDLRNTSAI